MPSKRYPKRYTNYLPQCLQNRLYHNRYFEVEDLSIGEGVVTRIASRNRLLISLKDESEVQVRLANISNKNKAYCWEAEQILHQMLANQKVYLISLGGELVADVCLPSGQSATEMLVKLGLAAVRHCAKIPKKEFKYLKVVQNKAETEKRGIWGLAHNLPSSQKIKINKLLFNHVEGVVRNIENINAIQILIQPDNVCIEVTLARRQNVIDAKELKTIAKEYLLHKQVKLQLQNYNICTNRFTGRIIHPDLPLLDVALWSSRKRQDNGKKTRTFTASVIEVLNGNSFTLRVKNKVIKNVFLSYITFPWQCGDMRHLCRERIANLKLLSMYYTHRLRFDAQEFLRGLLVGRNVKITVNYIDASEGVYCTMIAFGTDVAKLLLEHGFANADQTASLHGRKEYCAAENKAKEIFALGMHANPRQFSINVAWCMDNVWQLWAILQKGRVVRVVVEQVLSPSYIILFSVTLRWLFAFSLMDFEDVRRANTGVSKKKWKETVTRIIAEKCLQREVFLRVTSVDENGVLHGDLKMGTRSLRKLVLRRTVSRKPIRKIKTSAYSHLDLQWHRKPVWKVKGRVIKTSPNRVITRQTKRTGAEDATLMRGMRQFLRRNVKSLASSAISFSSPSPYCITRWKQKTFTTDCHIDQQHRKLMTAKLDSKMKKNEKTKEKQKKKKNKEAKQKSKKQQTAQQNKKKTKKRTMQNKQTKVKDKEEQTGEFPMMQITLPVMNATVSREVFKKKWKEMKNTVKLHWCCF